MRKVELFPTQDCEAGYGPEHKGSQLGAFCPFAIVYYYHELNSSLAILKT